MNELASAVTQENGPPIPSQMQILQHLDRSVDLIVKLLNRKDRDKFLIEPAVTSYTRFLSDVLKNINILSRKKEYEEMASRKKEYEEMASNFKEIKQKTEMLEYQTSEFPSDDSDFIQKTCTEIEKYCLEALQSFESFIQITEKIDHDKKTLEESFYQAYVKIQSLKDEIKTKFTINWI